MASSTKGNDEHHQTLPMRRLRVGQCLRLRPRAKALNWTAGTCCRLLGGDLVCGEECQRTADMIAAQYEGHYLPGMSLTQ